MNIAVFHALLLALVSHPVIFCTKPLTFDEKVSTGTKESIVYDICMKSVFFGRWHRLLYNGHCNCGMCN